VGDAVAVEQVSKLGVCGSDALWCRRLLGLLLDRDERD
jgi:hypothetical protein